MKFKQLTVCLDMHGCPNRCKHCWIGLAPNGNMPVSELESAAAQFRPFTESLEVFDWYREPDFRDNYKELWELCGRLSDRHTEHFELVSFWRIVRDKEYAKWLSMLGLKYAQLTIFGSEKTTDFYIGRKGAYKEILEAVQILLENKISPRIQTFVNKDNLAELEHIDNLIRELDLERHCASFGGNFSFFLHQGSCDGENEKLYEIRVTPDDIVKIPDALQKHTLKYFGTDNIMEVFGETEHTLYEKLVTDSSVSDYVSDSPVFYIDRDFNVYPNITAPAPHWCLGNLKNDGAEKIVENYTGNHSVAQHTRMTVPLCDIVKSQGSSESQRLFTESDYIEFLLNKYCRNVR